MNHTLSLFSDGSERVPYGHAEMPVFADIGEIAQFRNCASSTHWHDDVEFCVILSGEMSYTINGATHLLKEGEGAFVNARQFHNNFSTAEAPCKYLCVLFHPVLLCATEYIERTYIAPVISNSALPYLILTRETLWMAELIQDIERVYELCRAPEEDLYLSLESVFFRIWSTLYRHMPQPPARTERTNTRLSMLREMVGYVQKHYHERVTLSDIAAAANICQSSCCIIFNDYLHQTPIQYLIGYRLNKSAEMLKCASMSVTEIAIATGFAGTSYYSETFRKHFGLSPTAYRKRETEAEQAV